MAEVAVVAYPDFNLRNSLSVADETDEESHEKIERSSSRKLEEVKNALGGSGSPV